MRVPAILCFASLLASVALSTAGEAPSLKSTVFRIEELMSPAELQETGVSTLSRQQREALNQWLFNYTMRVLSTGQAVTPTRAAPETGVPSSPTVSNCVPATESKISGNFNGWAGETIFQLDNGEVWQQAGHEHLSSYSYNPMVTIFQTGSGCRMKVEDEEETILVRRIK